MVLGDLVTGASGAAPSVIIGLIACKQFTNLSRVASWY